MECGGSVPVSVQSGGVPASAGRGEELPSKDGVIFVLHERWAYRAPRAPCCAAGEVWNDGELVSGGVGKAGEFGPVAGVRKRRACQ